MDDSARHSNEEDHLQLTDIKLVSQRSYSNGRELSAGKTEELPARSVMLLN
jgi:hypothetical protein